jgi:cell division protein FtsB
MLRPLTLLLAVLILLLQYPLWLGKGGWLKVWEVERQVSAQKALNEQTQQRNAMLEAEVADLKNGTEAVEERARGELGMVQRDEVFFQVVGAELNLPASAANPPTH